MNPEAESVDEDEDITLGDLLDKEVAEPGIKWVLYRYEDGSSEIKPLKGRLEHLHVKKAVIYDRHSEAARDLKKGSK